MDLWRLEKRTLTSKGLPPARKLTLYPKAAVGTSGRPVTNPDWLQGKITLETDKGQYYGGGRKPVTGGVGGWV